MNVVTHWYIVGWNNVNKCSVHAMCIGCMSCIRYNACANDRVGCMYALHIHPQLFRVKFGGICHTKLSESKLFAWLMHTHPASRMHQPKEKSSMAPSSLTSTRRSSLFQVLSQSFVSPKIKLSSWVTMRLSL